jgi:hypothetical protein
MKGVKTMNTKEAFEAMRQGKRVRRPCWRSGYEMYLNEDGIEVTVDAHGNMLSMGYREFNNADPQDWQVTS